jgi:ComEC/Rec2-related protein
VVWGLAAALAAGVLQNPLFAGAGALVSVWHARPLCRRRREAIFLFILSAILYGYGHQSTNNARAHVEHFDAWSRDVSGPVWISGWVASYPQPGYGGVRFEFVTTIDGVRHRLWIRTSEFVIDYGDSLRLHMDPRRSKRARAPGKSYWIGRGLCGAAKALPGSVETLEGSNGNILRRRALWPIHRRIRVEIHRNLGARAGLPIALLLGERGVLERRVRDGFATLGIAHLLALSGFHLGFIAAILLLVGRIARVRSRIPLVVVLTVYVAVVGLIFSLLRALIIVVLLILAAALHRPLRPVTALVNAFLLMILAYPHAIFSVGFQLSFVATFAVLLAVRGLPAPPTSGLLRRTLYWIQSTVRVGTVVQLALAPMLLTYFERISIAAPLTTVVFVGPVMLLLAITTGATVLGCVWTNTAGCVFGVLGCGVRVFEWLLDAAVDITPAPIEVAAPNAILFYAGLVAITGSRKCWWIRVMGFVVWCVSWVQLFR